MSAWLLVALLLLTFFVALSHFVWLALALMAVTVLAVVNVAGELEL